MTPLGNNKETMRLENRKQVLNLIHQQPISRSALAKETGLTQSAIGNIINDLLEIGIICETVKADDELSPGRRPILLDIVPFWKTIVGVSIDHEGFEVGLINLRGEIIGPISHLPYHPHPLEALDNISGAVFTLIQQAGIPPEKILGIGAIAPGPVNVTAGCILNPPRFERWHYFPLREELQARLPYPVQIQHNANALARSEFDIGGAGKAYNSFALLAINDGIGLGLALDGKIYAGTNGLGCEIGHTSIDFNGRLCSCGNRGCLELYASTSAILYETGRIHPEITQWEQLVDNAYNGDTFCNAMLDLQAEYLAHSIINLNNLLELEAIILTGTAAYRGELLLNKLRLQVQQRVLSKGMRSLTFQLSRIQSHPLVVAAGSVLLYELFNGELFLRELNHKTSGSRETGNPETKG